MREKIKCRYCITVGDIRRRYDEDIEDAMEDGFQGPVAKALHAFEMLQALVVALLMVATLALVLINWVFAENLRYVDASFLVVPSAGNCRYSTTSKILYYWGGRKIPCNMLDYDANGTKVENKDLYKSRTSEDLYPLPPSNTSNYPYEKCTFLMRRIEN